jgi:hypothetical protein
MPMKARIYFRVVIVTLSLAGTISCNKTLDVNADWKEVTVAYGLLDQTDTVHYLRIGKAFLGEGNALVYAGIADCTNYSKSLDVRLNEYLDGKSLVRSIRLRDTLITDKDSGLFSYPSQTAWYTSAALDPQYTYSLSVSNTISGDEVESNTALIGSFALEKPAHLPGFNVLPGKMTDIRWTSAENGKRYQLAIRIHYREIAKSDSVTTYRYVDWIPFTAVRTGGTQGGLPVDYLIPGDQLYAFLHLNIPVNTDVYRALGLIDFNFTVGSEDLDSYMMAFESSPNGNTSLFTNIRNGVGLLASRYHQSFTDYFFSQVTRDSIRTNKLTKDLGF